MFCPYYAQSQCRSCSKIAIDYLAQVNDKQMWIQNLLHVSDAQLCRPVLSAEEGFRNKAKMVVLGVAQSPVLGIEDKETRQAISLSECPLYSQTMKELIKALPDWIRNAGIPPYNRYKRKGELKYVLLTQSQYSGRFMLRFVLHSEKVVPRLASNLSDLCACFPDIEVVTANIQPVHMARLEGEKEIFFSEARTLEEKLNHVPLFIKPKSFFQTNPLVAEQLYQTATQWAIESQADVVWDLFCGVGGFALHCAKHFKSVIGIEIEPEAIACATLSAKKLGVDNLSFAALDSEEFSRHPSLTPDLVIVNPPRRGLGQTLVERLNQIMPQTILYSSCNPNTLADDLRGLDYEIARVQWFDMFPHTEHMEVLVELRRR